MTIETSGRDQAEVRGNRSAAAAPSAAPGPHHRTRGIKARGTRAETALVELLRQSGWPHAERRALHGTTDRGDIAGVPGVVLEQKSGARLRLPEWLRETEAERINDGADYGVLIVKLRGYGQTRVGEWPAVLPLGALLRLLRDAGYGGSSVLPTLENTGRK